MTQPPDEDAALLRRFIAGDRDALGELARRYERAMLGMARGLLRGSEPGARDAVQATWVRVIRFARTYKGTSSVRTWLYTILLNECRAARATRRAPALVGGGNGHGVVHATDAELCAALERLDEMKREALLLCYHEGMTHALAAEVLGIPVGTVKSRVHAGLEELRGIMGVREHEVAR